MQSALKYLLMYSRTVGMDPFVQNKTSLLLNIINFCALLFLLGPYCLEMLYYFDGFESIKDMELIALPVEGICLAIFFLLKKDTIRDLIITTQFFWSADRFGARPEIKIRKIKHNFFMCLVISLLSFFTAAFLIFLEILVNNDKKYHYLGYQQCKSSLCIYLQLAFQFFAVVFELIPITSIFTAYFGLFVMEAYCSIEMLACGYNNLGKSSGSLKKDIKDLVEQHILILRFIATINRIFKNVLVFLFAMYTLFLTFSLTMILINGTTTSPSALVNYSMYLLWCLVQTAIFCFGGTILQNKSNSLIHVVYDINWWDVGKQRVKFGKDNAYILQVTQRDVSLTIGSMIPLNLNTWLQIMKLAYSVSTLIRSFQRGDNVEK